MAGLLVFIFTCGLLELGQSNWDFINLTCFANEYVSLYDWSLHLYHHDSLKIEGDHSISNNASRVILLFKLRSWAMAAISPLLLFGFPINDWTASRTSSITPPKAYASCRKRLSTSSKREKLARTNLPLMGSIIFMTLLLAILSAFGKREYSLHESMQFCPLSYLRTEFW